jgi:GNAT superfamily N-acetyltransferase
MSAIEFCDHVNDLRPEQLQGFFEGWPNPPAPEVLLRILEAGAYVEVARVGPQGQLVGYICAISDGISCAYIPYLEVLPSFRGQGIASELVRRLLRRLEGFYMVDLVCDEELRPFYERLGFHPHSAMIRRNYARQSCA